MVGLVGAEEEGEDPRKMMDFLLLPKRIYIFAFWKSSAYKASIRETSLELCALESQGEGEFCQGGNMFSCL